MSSKLYKMSSADPRGWTEGVVWRIHDPALSELTAEMNCRMPTFTEEAQGPAWVLAWDAIRHLKAKVGSICSAR